MSIPPRFLSPHEIEKRALRFLETYNPRGELPVPIEEILESDLHLEIRFFPGLEARYGILAYISNDLTTVYVDADLPSHSLTRYRFSLAHEIGHYILHADFIRGLEAENVDQWKVNILRFPDDVLKRVEIQANLFAKYVLVPVRTLANAIEEGKYLFYQRGVDMGEIGDFGMLIEWLAGQFRVSLEVILNCLERDGFYRRNR